MSKKIQPIAICAFIALTAGLLLFFPFGPEPAGPGAPPETFSAERALIDVRNIARVPHTVGSAENERVKNHIIAKLKSFAVEVKLQEAEAVMTWFTNFHMAGFVKNIAARVRGTSNAVAVCIVGHYDSVPTGPGANDDAAAVAAMLETIRALKCGTPLKNDVIFLFTDGEEAGLLGASAFVREHPWRNSVKLVLNFEARGSGGPSTLFETSPGNSWLISGFAKAAPHPYGNSLTNAVYGYMPNDTDFSVFREAGYAGLNFAYPHNVNAYHTMLDSADNVDARSIQHHGEYMLSLARHFGNEPLNDLKKSDSVYFSICSKMMARYPALAGLIFALTALCAFAGIIIHYAGKKVLIPAKIFAGFGASLAALIAVPLGVFGIWRAVNAIHGEYGWMFFGDTYNSFYYRTAFIAFSMFGVSVMRALVKNHLNAAHIHAGAGMLWAMLTAVSAVFLPGAGYLFLWPFVFSIPVLIVLSRADETKPFHLALITVFSLPSLIMMTDVLRILFEGLTLKFAAGTAFIAALFLLLFIPLIDGIQGKNTKIFPASSAFLCIIFLAGGSMTASFTEKRPRPDSIVYALDADKARAVWATCDREPDEWTAQFFSGDTRREPLEIFPMAEKCLFKPYSFLTAKAPAASLNPPVLRVVEDSTAGSRKIRFRALPGNDFSVLMIFIKNKGVSDISVNGKRLRVIDEKNLKPGIKFILGQVKFREWVMIHYYAVRPEGIELSLVAENGVPVEVRLLSVEYGIPRVPGFSVKPRPPHIIPSPDFLIKDATVVGRKFML